MPRIKSLNNLMFPGMLDNRYQMYRAQLISAEQAARKAAKAPKRDAAKSSPVITGK